MLRKILFADDEENIRNLLKCHLKNSGYEVELAKDGEEAVAIARKERPNLIILDVMMPNMDGPTAADILKNDPLTKHIPVIFLTSLVAQGESGLPNRDENGQLFLAKPIVLKVLLESIERCMAQTI